MDKNIRKLEEMGTNRNEQNETRKREEMVRSGQNLEETERILKKLEKKKQ